MRTVQAAKARGENPYPHKFEVSIQLPAYVAKYADLEAGTQVGGVGGGTCEQQGQGLKAAV